MAITRAKATTLLNKAEMGLFDDSRSNAIRGHSEARLNQLVTRARTARDRARDLEKRQRLASRQATGSKSGRSGLANARTGDKVEVLSDILSRFEARQSQTAKSSANPAAKKAVTAKKVATKSAPAKKVAKKVATAKAAAAAPAAKKRAAAKKGAKTAAASGAASTGRGAAPKTPAKSSARKSPAGTTSAGAAGRADASAAREAASKRASSAAPVAKKTDAPTDGKSSAPARAGRARAASAVTPEKALRNTRKLLEARQAEAHSAKPWETLGADGAVEAAPGFQSPRARAKALDLHAAEIRQAPIQGSISTRGRKSQGKRDNRNSNDNG